MGRGRISASRPMVLKVKRFAMIDMRSKRGFTIIEILIGLAFIAAALATYLKLQENEVREGVARVQADHLKLTKEIFEKYYNDNARSILRAAGALNSSDPAVQSHCVVMVANTSASVNPGTSPGVNGPNGRLAWSGGTGIDTGLKTCAYDLSLLRAKGVFLNQTLPISYHDVGLGGSWRYVAVVKRVRGSGPNNILGDSDDVLTKDAEMLVVRMDEDASLTALNQQIWRGQESAFRQQTLNIYRNMGASGVYLPVGRGGSCASTSTQSEVCGVGWVRDINHWISPSHVTTLRGRMPNN